MLLGDLPRLEPLLLHSAAAMDTFFKSLNRFIDNRNFSAFVSSIDRLMGPTMGRFGTFLGNLGGTMANLTIAFAPLAEKMEKGLVGITGSWLKWSESLQHNKGFQNFLKEVAQDWPVVERAIGSIAHFFGSLGNNATGLTALSLLTQVFNDLAVVAPYVMRVFQGVALAIQPLLNPVAGLVRLLAKELLPVMPSLRDAVRNVVGPVATLAGDVLKAAGAALTFLRHIHALTPVLEGLMAYFVAAKIASWGLALVGALRGAIGPAKNLLKWLYGIRDVEAVDTVGGAEAGAAAGGGGLLTKMFAGGGLVATLARGGLVVGGAGLLANEMLKLTGQQGLARTATGSSHQWLPLRTALTQLENAYAYHAHINASEAQRHFGSIENMLP
ncbi:MAG: hypothetical protein ACRDL8_12265, partial [Solirubrobacteraceae bacterium]